MSNILDDDLECLLADHERWGHGKATWGAREDRSVVDAEAFDTIDPELGVHTMISVRAGPIRLWRNTNATFEERSGNKGARPYGQW